MAANLKFLSLHPFVRDTAHQKLLGTIVGSALGDTIGLYTEFLPASAAREAYPTRRFSLLPKPTAFHADSHRDRFAAAAWTDDTDHALLILLAYLHSGGNLDALPLDFAARLAIWSTQGLRCLDRPPLGIGRTIGLAARDPNFPSNPEAVATEQWLRSGRRAAANGSLMRTHPLGLMAVPLARDAAFALAARMSRTTHPDPRCVVSCCAVVALVRGIVRGEVRTEADVDELLQAAFDYVATEPRLRYPDLDNTGQNASDDRKSGEGSDELQDQSEFSRYTSAHDFLALQLDDAMSMGYVYKCLGAAVFALRKAMRLTKSGASFARGDSASSQEQQCQEGHTGSVVFEEIITELTMLGGDADTNCCVAGALIGAWIGFDGLPTHWVGGLAHRGWLIAKSEGLSRLIGIKERGEAEEELPDADTAPDGGKPLMTLDQLKKRDLEFTEAMLKRRARREEETKEGGQRKPHGLDKWIKMATMRKRD
jgi:ADP-ribosylglycohydrolase